MSSFDTEEVHGVMLAYPGRAKLHPVEFSRLRETPFGGFHWVKIEVPKTQGLRSLDHAHLRLVYPSQAGKGKEQAYSTCRARPVD